MFYCKGDDNELEELVGILEKYSLASGQRINYQKSSIYFGKRIPVQRREQIKRKLGITQEGGEGVYLGLPESFGGAKVSILSYLKERLQQKVMGWQNNFLSAGGKEIMLKSVAMALPTYTMSCFLIPKKLCQQIAAVMAEYWWRNSKEKRGIHWKSLDKVCRSKKEGGLGFRDIESFNLALLGKELWRMLTCKETLLARVFKARYFQKSDPLKAKLGSRPSYAWRSIIEAQKIIKKGARAIIGNGEEISIWEDQWLDNMPARPIKVTRRVQPNLREEVSKMSRVKDLMIQGGREWNKELLLAVFAENDVRKIEEIRPGGERAKDSYCWDFTHSGHYTVKSGYWVMTTQIKNENQANVVNQPSLDALYQIAWKTDTTPKIKHFLWRCISNSLAVTTNLKQRRLLRDTTCARCQGQDESVNHLLFQCAFARLVWAISSVPAPQNGVMADSIYINFHRVMTITQTHPQETEAEKLSPWIMWRIWKNRNDLVIKGVEFDAMETVMKAKEDKEEWGKREEERGKEKGMRQSLPVNRRTRWQPPPTNWLKCNIDGTWNANTEASGIGWVLRDHQGKVLWMRGRRIPKLRSVIETEMEAMRWAILSITRFSYRNVIFETDSKAVAEVIKEENLWPKANGVIQDIQDLLSTFGPHSVLFFPRETNGVADRIAKETLSYLNYVPKLYTVLPNWISPSVEVV